MYFINSGYILLWLQKSLNRASTLTLSNCKRLNDQLKLYVIIYFILFLIVQPLVTRQIRADLNDAAKKASIDVFAKNLKQLLLMSPLKGERILGIDPGFTNGCKLALISETADVLETDVIYPHRRQTDPEECGEILAKLLAKHK